MTPPIVVSEVASGVFAVDTPLDDGPLQVHVVVGDTVAIIDSGVSTTPERHLLPALFQLGVRPKDISHILLTHGHYDHTGGMFVLQAAVPHARVLAHPAEAPEAADASSVAALYSPIWPSVWQPTREFMASVRLERGGDCRVDGDLRDSDTIDLGAGHRLRVIEAPGHSPGHVALLEESTDVLIVGDVIVADGNGPGMFPLYESPLTLASSYKRIQAAQARFICTAHHGVLDAADAQALMNRDLQMRDDLRELLRSSGQAAGTLTPQSATAAVHNRYPDRSIGLGICRTIQGHMQALADTGEITTTIAGGEPTWHFNATS